MRIYGLGVIAALGMACLAPISAQAAELMPDFGNVPTGWTTDRYDPNSFVSTDGVHGRNDVLQIGISPADGLGNRLPGFNSQFYNTQGRGHVVSGGKGSTLSASLYLEDEWANPANGNVRSDVWGVAPIIPAVGPDPHDYPIIGFTNYGGAGRLRYWDGNIGWVDLATAVVYGAWVDLKIELALDDKYNYYVNGALVGTDTTTNGATGFERVIMQAYNFCGDSSLVGAVCVPYTANWSNLQGADVPEPGTLTLVGAGLLGLGIARRRKMA